MQAHNPPVDYQNEAASIGTNSYSIVSKRSVEKIYHANETPFLKPFVPKFKRRAPLINRGYWLRTIAIENAIKHFLRQPVDRQKIIMNLGCGFDLLPFRMKYKQLAGEAKFIDVDYAALIRQKLAIISEDVVLSPYVCKESTQLEYGDAQITDFGWYCAVGCDLGDIEIMSRVFEDTVNIVDCEILFLAEVSITYMPLNKADDLLRWTASHEHANFLLLEQILPAGPDHPFAKTMLDHFAKQTPLQSVFQYSTLQHQRNRFLSAGYLSVDARSLWDFWEDSNSLDVEEKERLDNVEPFDEWEEFILFASHYVILHASGTKPFEYNHLKIPLEFDSNLQGYQTDLERSFDILEWNTTPKCQIGTRLISSLQLTDPDSKDVSLAVPLSAPSTALNHWTVYGTRTPPNWPLKIPITGISCYTITPVGVDASLLVGGRTSPSKSNSQCFLYRNSSNTWTRVQDLEIGRYRHCAVSVQIGTESGVLVFGGRTGDNRVLSDWRLWIEQIGWIAIPCVSPLPNFSPPALFGASMIEGLILGGMDESYRFSHKLWRWSIEGKVSMNSSHQDFLKVKILINSAEMSLSGNFTARFGGKLLELSSAGLMLVGGVGPVPLRGHEEVCHIVGDKVEPQSVFIGSIPRPLFVGAVVDILDRNTNTLLITCGGGVCFSFGSCFNTHWYIIQGRKTNSSKSWAYFTGDEKPRLPILDKSQPDEPTTNLVYDYSSAESILECGLGDVHEIISIKLKPAVVRQIDMGTCIPVWNLTYLDTKLGSLNIAIHEGSNRYLTFTPRKNFQYRTCAFSEFKVRLERKEHVYLRALAFNGTFKEPANFWNDFPIIAKDFKIPEVLNVAFDLNNRFHSAVLRMSGDVSIWIHYDVMSNFYFQIYGSKTFLIFPPSEALKLKFAPGETVSPMDSTSDFQNISHKVVHLNAGDVLFIPRFWAHTTFNSQTGCTTSIAINVFWRDLDAKSYAAGKDVYGNRDLAVYERGRETVQRMANGLRSQSTGLTKEQAQKLSACKFKDEEVQNIPEVKELLKVRAKMAEMSNDVEEFYFPRLVGELVQLDQRNDD